MTYTKKVLGMVKFTLKWGQIILTLLKIKLRLPLWLIFSVCVIQVMKIKKYKIALFLIYDERFCMMAVIMMIIVVMMVMM